MVLLFFTVKFMVDVSKIVSQNIDLLVNGNPVPYMDTTITGTSNIRKVMEHNVKVEIVIIQALLFTDSNNSNLAIHTTLETQKLLIDTWIEMNVSKYISNGPTITETLFVDELINRGLSQTNVNNLLTNISYIIFVDGEHILDGNVGVITLMNVLVRIDSIHKPTDVLDDQLVIDGTVPANGKIKRSVNTELYDKLKSVSLDPVDQYQGTSLVDLGNSYPDLVNQPRRLTSYKNLPSNLLKDLNDITFGINNIGFNGTTVVVDRDLMMGILIVNDPNLTDGITIEYDKEPVHPGSYNKQDILYIRIPPAEEFTITDDLLIYIPEGIAVSTVSNYSRFNRTINVELQGTLAPWSSFRKFNENRIYVPVGGVIPEHDEWDVIAFANIDSCDISTLKAHRIINLSTDRVVTLFRSANIPFTNDFLYIPDFVNEYYTSLLTRTYQSVALKHGAGKIVVTRVEDQTDISKPLVFTSNVSRVMGGDLRNYTYSLQGNYPINVEYTNGTYRWTNYNESFVLPPSSIESTKGKHPDDHSITMEHPFRKYVNGNDDLNNIYRNIYISRADEHDFKNSSWDFYNNGTVISNYKNEMGNYHNTASVYIGHTTNALGELRGVTFDPKVQSIVDHIYLDVGELESQEYLKGVLTTDFNNSSNITIFKNSYKGKTYSAPYRRTQYSDGDYYTNDRLFVNGDTNDTYVFPTEDYRNPSRDYSSRVQNESSINRINFVIEDTNGNIMKTAQVDGHLVNVTIT